MKLEQILPALKSVEKITITKPYNDKNTVFFVKLENERLKFKVIFTTGDIINWASYRLNSEDVLAENWEVAG